MNTLKDSKATNLYRAVTVQISRMEKLHLNLHADMSPSDKASHIWNTQNPRLNRVTKLGNLKDHAHAIQLNLVSLLYEQNPYLLLC